MLSEDPRTGEEDGRIFGGRQLGISFREFARRAFFVNVNITGNSFTESQSLR